MNKFIILECSNQGRTPISPENTFNTRYTSRIRNIQVPQTIQMLRPLLSLILILTPSTWALETSCFCPATARGGRCTDEWQTDSEPQWEHFTSKWFCQDVSNKRKPRTKCSQFSKKKCRELAEITCPFPPASKDPEYRSCIRETRDQTCASFEKIQCGHSERGEKILISSSTHNPEDKITKSVASSERHPFNGASAEDFPRHEGHVKGDVQTHSSPHQGQDKDKPVSEPPLNAEQQDMWNAI